MLTDSGWICAFRSKSWIFLGFRGNWGANTAAVSRQPVKRRDQNRQSLLPDTENSVLEADPIPVLTQAASLSFKCAMSILTGRRRFILFLSISILISQLTFAAGQNNKGGVTVSYEQSGTSRIARFKNSNPYHVRVEFSYQGTKTRGSGEASGQDAVLVPGNFSATYGAQGLSITSVRITRVMRMD